MSIVDDIKKAAQGNNTKIQTSEAANLEKILNKMFYLEKDIDEEVKFINHIMTRGLESQERKGLHASALIVSDKQFCVRQQVLSLIYKQLQGEQNPVGLKRIFEEGNAIHEKWQRLFIRAGYAKTNTLDRTRMNSDYMVSFTPDIVCKIPEFYEGAMIGEIKSVNTFQFKKMNSHPSGHKQLLFYMFNCIHEAKKNKKWNGVDYLKGFVLCEDKNTQDTKIFLYDYDPEFVIPFVDRCEDVMFHYHKVINDGKMVGRCNNCSSYDCDMAKKCNMKDACWNKNGGRIKL